MKSVVAVIFFLVAAVQADPQWNNKNDRDRNNGRTRNIKSERIFRNENGQRKIFLYKSGKDHIFDFFSVSARCYNGQEAWDQYTWKIGGIRPDYYVDKGNRRNLDDCVRQCDRDPYCYFATLTYKKRCWILTTSDKAFCRYARGTTSGGHFGRLSDTDRCTNKEPCESAYRVCKEPRCTLYSIMERYCRTNDQDKAIDTCDLSHPK